MIFNIGTTLGDAFSPMMNMSIYATLSKTYTSILNFSFIEEFTYHHFMDCCFGSEWWCHIWSPVMMVSGNCHFHLCVSSIGVDKQHEAFFLFMCEHSWNPPVANITIFQSCYNHFQCIKTFFELSKQFPGWNPAWNLACPSHCLCFYWNTPPTAWLC